MSPLSSGCRSASMTSAAEQRELVEEEHPAVRPADLARVAPAGAAADQAGACWRRGAGAANGGRVSSPSPGSSAPASECTAVSSSASSRVRSGRSPGIRSASWSCRSPSARSSSRWCPPAAATSTANRASSMPTRSARSIVVQPVGAAPGEQRAAGHRARPAAPRAPRLAAQLGDHLGQRPQPEHVHPRHQRRLPGLRLGHEDPARSRGRRGHHHRQHARAPTAARRPGSARRSARGVRAAPASGTSAGGAEHARRRWPGRSGCRAWAGRPARAGP